VTTEVYEFGEDFEKLILAYMLKDMSFCVRTEGLVKPQYFESELHAVLGDIAGNYFTTYKSIPSGATLGILLKDALDKKRVRSEMKADFIQLVKDVLKTPLTDLDFTVESVAKFARRQEMTAAILKSAELIEKGDYDKVEPIMQRAILVGSNDDAMQYDFFAERENRAKYREEVVAGRIKKDGITTGHRKMDELLYHGGWGRKELTCFMGPAKAGKSMSLIQFGLNAVAAGYNVLYVSLEVATKIIADRLDANIGQIEINNLPMQMKKASDAVALVESRAGILKIHDFPTGTMSPNQLRRLINRYKAQGIIFDMVCVDYADLMAPNVYSNEPRENSRTIYIDLRGIASEFNLALLTATQTNRAGFKEAVGKMENVSEDINKVRTVDLLISINRDDEDKANNTTRLYFAASRNQGEATITIKTNNKMARFMESIVAIDGEPLK